MNQIKLITDQELLGINHELDLNTLENKSPFDLVFKGWQLALSSLSSEQLKRALNKFKEHNQITSINNYKLGFYSWLSGAYDRGELEE